MRATGNAPASLRFAVAYLLAGIVFVALLVPSLLLGLPGMLFLVLPLAAAYAVLFALSRTARFRDVGRGLEHAPYYLVFLTLAALVLLWADSLTGLNDRLAAFNGGAPLRAGLVLDVIAAGLLVAGAFFAASALASRDRLDMGMVHTFVAANMLLLVYALAPTAISGLPAAPNPLIPLAGLVLMSACYVRWAIISRREAALSGRGRRRR